SRFRAEPPPDAAPGRSLRAACTGGRRSTALRAVRAGAPTSRALASAAACPCGLRRRRPPSRQPLWPPRAARRGGGGSGPRPVAADRERPAGDGARARGHADRDCLGIVGEAGSCCASCEARVDESLQLEPVRIGKARGIDGREAPCVAAPDEGSLP